MTTDVNGNCAFVKSQKTCVFLLMLFLEFATTSGSSCTATFRGLFLANFIQGAQIIILQMQVSFLKLNSLPYSIGSSYIIVHYHTIFRNPSTLFSCALQKFFENVTHHFFEKYPPEMSSYCLYPQNLDRWVVHRVWIVKTANQKKHEISAHFFENYHGRQPGGR